MKPLYFLSLFLFFPLDGPFCDPISISISRRFCQNFPGPGCSGGSACRTPTRTTSNAIFPWGRMGWWFCQIIPIPIPSGASAGPFGPVSKDLMDPLALSGASARPLLAPFSQDLTDPLAPPGVSAGPWPSRRIYRIL